MSRTILILLAIYLLIFQILN